MAHLASPGGSTATASVGRARGGTGSSVAGSAGERWLRYFGIAALTLAFAAALALRRPAGLDAATIWAEDGREFLALAATKHWALFEVYAGETWVLQRLLADAVSVLPVQWWPIGLYLVSVLVAASSIAVTLQERMRPLLGEFWFRLFAAVLLVLLPSVWETQGNIANAHWWAAGAAMLVLAAPPAATKGGRAAEIVFLVVVGLSGINALLLLPVALWRVLSDRSTYVLARSALMGALALVNAAVFVFLGTRAAPGDPGAAVLRAPGYIAKRLLGGLAIGEHWLLQWWLAGAVSALLVLCLLMGALLVALVVLDLRGPSWAWLAVGLVTAVLGVVGTSPFFYRQLFEPYAASRYVLLFAFGAVLVMGRALGVGGRWQQVLGGVAVALMALAMIGDARLPPMGEAIPPAQLDALAECLAADAPPGTQCALRIAPSSADWQLVITK